jgi:hypothetical protein
MAHLAAFFALFPMNTTPKAQNPWKSLEFCFFSKTFCLQKFMPKCWNFRKIIVVLLKFQEIISEIFDVFLTPSCRKYWEYKKHLKSKQKTYNFYQNFENFRPIADLQGRPWPGAARVRGGCLRSRFPPELPRGIGANNVNPQFQIFTPQQSPFGRDCSPQKQRKICCPLEKKNSPMRTRTRQLKFPQRGARGEFQVYTVGPGSSLQAIRLQK